MAELKCKDQIKERWASRRADFKQLFKKPEGNDELSPLSEYGLCIDFVPARTFTGQLHGYYRYQLSWGGPSDEVRVWRTGNKPILIEYWFMDWGDGAKLNITRDLIGQELGRYILENVNQGLREKFKE